MKKLVLAPLHPFAQGMNRRVYVHPDNAELLIKVLRPDRAQWFRKQHFAWYQKRRRYLGYSSVLQELREQLAVHAHEERASPHLQNIVGLADTDFGLGLVVEALKDAQGGYAPSLSRLLKEDRFDASARRDLDTFFAWLLQSPLVVTDLTWSNLLYAHDDNDGRRFVLVDGYGESVALPVRTLFDFFNRRSKRQRIQALRDRVATRDPNAAD